MQFQFDARRVAPSQGREIWPGGWYQVVITAHDIKPTQNGKGQRLALSIVGNDDTNGKRGQANEIGLNIGNDNPTTVQIAYETLSAICWVVGKPAINDLNELHGVPFYAFTPNEKDAQSNNWRGFKNMQGVDAVQVAVQGGGTTQRTGQQQQPPQGQQPNFQQPQGQQQQPQGNWQPNGGGQGGGWGQQGQQPPAQGQQPGGWGPPGGAAPPAQQPQGQPPAQAGWGPPQGQQQQQPQGQPPPAQGWQQGGQQPGAAAPWQQR